MSELFEQGFDFYRIEPELTLAQVWWRLPKDMPFPDQHEFVEGYKEARRKRDDYLREKKNEAP